MCRNLSSVWWFRVAVVVMVVVVAVVEASRHSQNHNHPTDHRKASSSRLDELMNRLDDSVQEKKRRLRGLPSIHYRTDESDAEKEDGPAILRGGDGDDDGDAWDGDETHIETLDYLNVAPWTRRTTTTTPPPLAAYDLQMIRLATENAKWVKEEGKCEEPQRRCETVRSEEHPIGTMFWPRCALLHRCDEGTGCCLAHKTCAPEDTENVRMYFYVLGGQRAKIEVLTFVNHTRCSCQLRSAVEAQVTPRLNCRCPQKFTVSIVDGRCMCDCDASRSRCRKYKRGRRTFSINNISCIVNKECGEPKCEYGSFLVRQRRCPRRRERDMYTTVSN